MKTADSWQIQYRVPEELDELGFHFVRYADDSVVLCRTELKAKEARTQVEQLLQSLGLSLSPTKTRVTTFLKGFTFLGFDVTSHGRVSWPVRPMI